MNLNTYRLQLWNSLSTLNVYPFLVSQSFKTSLLFFSLSYLWLSIIATGQLIIRDLPQAQAGADQALNELQTHYPPDTVITWDGSQLSHTSSQPLKISYPTSLSADRFGLPPVLGFMLNESPSREQLTAATPERSLFVTTPTHLYMNDLQGEWSQLPLTEVMGFDQPFTINSETLPGIIEYNRQLATAFFQFLKIATAILFPFAFILHRVWTILIESLLAFGLLRLNGIKLGYGKVLQLSMHLLVVAEVINQTAHLLYRQLELPLLSMTFWLVLILVVVTQRPALLSLTPRKTSHQQSQT